VSTYLSIENFLEILFAEKLDMSVVSSFCTKSSDNSGKSPDNFEQLTKWGSTVMKLVIWAYPNRQLLLNKVLTVLNKTVFDKMSKKGKNSNLVLLQIQVLWWTQILLSSYKSLNDVNTHNLHQWLVEIAMKGLLHPVICVRKETVKCMGQMLLIDMDSIPSSTIFNLFRFMAEDDVESVVLVVVQLFCEISLRWGPKQCDVLLQRGRHSTKARKNGVFGDVIKEVETWIKLRPTCKKFPNSYMTFNGPNPTVCFILKFTKPQTAIKQTVKKGLVSSLPSCKCTVTPIRRVTCLALCKIIAKNRVHRIFRQNYFIKHSHVRKIVYHMFHWRYELLKSRESVLLHIIHNSMITFSQSLSSVTIFLQISITIAKEACSSFSALNSEFCGYIMTLFPGAIKYLEIHLTKLSLKEREDYIAKIDKLISFICDKCYKLSGCEIQFSSYVNILIRVVAKIFKISHEEPAIKSVAKMLRLMRALE
jgi:hypothetical protein